MTIWDMVVGLAIFVVVCMLCLTTVIKLTEHDPNPFAVGDKVSLMGKTGVVSDSFTAFGKGIVKVRFILSGPNGEHFEEIQCKVEELTFVRE